MLAKGIAQRGPFTALNWQRKIVNETFDNHKYWTESDTKDGYKYSELVTKRTNLFEDWAANKERDVIDVPTECPDIAFDYYKNILPEEFHHVIADVEAEWSEATVDAMKSGEKSGQKEILFTDNYPTKKEVNDLLKEHKPYSAKQALMDRQFEYSKFAADMWAKRSAKWGEYGDYSEYYRSNIHTKPEDRLDAFPWLRQQIEQANESGDYMYDVDNYEFDALTVSDPKAEAKKGLAWGTEEKIMFDWNYPQHDKEDAKFGEIVDALQKIEEGMKAEEKAVWKFKGITHKAPTYAQYAEYASK